MTSLKRGSVNRSRPPQSGPVRPFHLPAVDEDRLPEGLELRILRESRVPLVSGCLVLDAGEVVVPGSEAGLAVLTGDALQGGTVGRSGADLARALEGLGTSFRVSTGWDATTITFTCTAERMGATLSLLAEVTTRPSLPEEEVGRVRRQRLAAIQQRRKDPAALADDEGNTLLFPEGHPYHRPLAGLEGSVQHLGPSEARSWVEARYRPGGAGLVLVGDLDPEDARRAAENGFSGWEGGVPARKTLPPSGPASHRRVVLVHRPEAVQTELRILHPGPGKKHPHRLPLQVANAVLGGTFTSRLNLNLRERHGFTYGVRSGFSHRREGGVFRISTAVATGVTTAALREAMAELDRFHAQGPTQEEVARVRDYLAGVFPLRMETTAQLAARFGELLIHRLPSDEHHRYRDLIRGVTREEAGEAFAGQVSPEAVRILLCGDAEVLAPEVEALGLGEVVIRRVEGP